MNQIEKNTVQAEKQLKKSEYVSFFRQNGNGTRVMFVGNSITRHGVKHDIGWHNDWGMAASAADKDYVHLVADGILQKDANASFCICQVAEWERNCYHGEDVLDLYAPARAFAADVIIMRLVENCPRDSFDSERFQEEYGGLLAYLNETGKAKVIITTGFWKHIADEAIRTYAKKNGFPLVELNDLGEDERMKAIGLFEHSGVANHPGDLGMQAIAEKILTQIEAIL